MDIFKINIVPVQVQGESTFEAVDNVCSYQFINNSNSNIATINNVIKLLPGKYLEIGGNPNCIINTTVTVKGDDVTVIKNIATPLK